MPALCRKGVLDGNPPRMKVLFHDTSDPQAPSSDQVDSVLKQMMGVFHPPTCALLRVNRKRSLLNAGAYAAAGAEEERQKLWNTFIPHLLPTALSFRQEKKGTISSPSSPGVGDASSPGGGASPAADGGSPDPLSDLDRRFPRQTREAKARQNFLANLTQADCQDLQNLVKQVVLNLAIPWVERKVDQLAGVVATQKRGLQNQIRGFFRKARDEDHNSGSEVVTSTSASSVVYSQQSTEGQIRLAADLCFLLRDYEQAQSFYKTVVSDFKQDRSWLHVASCLEQQAVCSFFHNPRDPGEWEKTLRQAWEFYSEKAGMAQLGIRLLIFYTAAAAFAANLQDVAKFLHKAGGELPPDDPNSTALLIDRASVLYLRAGWRRKAVFHAVLAGHTFQKGGLRKLALRCYCAVMRLALQGGRGVEEGDQLAAGTSSASSTVVGNGAVVGTSDVLTIGSTAVNQHTSHHARWMHTCHHVHFTMARHCYGLSLFPEAVFHFHSLLDSFAGGLLSTSEVFTPRPITPTCWLYKRDAPTLILYVCGFTTPGRDVSLGDSPVATSRGRGGLNTSILFGCSV